MTHDERKADARDDMKDLSAEDLLEAAANAAANYGELVAAVETAIEQTENGEEHNPKAIRKLCVLVGYYNGDIAPHNTDAFIERGFEREAY